MYHIRQNNVLGLLFIILGFVLLIVVAGHLLARAIMILIALGLVNYGLQMRGMPPLQVLIRMWLAMAGW
jgi:hypothetical protein